jgi:hypothetical protein
VIWLSAVPQTFPYHQGETSCVIPNTVSTPQLFSSVRV